MENKKKSFNIKNSLIGLILTIVALSLLCMPSKNQVDELTMAN